MVQSSSTHPFNELQRDNQLCEMLIDPSLSLSLSLRGGDGSKFDQLHPSSTGDCSRRPESLNRASSRGRANLPAHLASQSVSNMFWRVEWIRHPEQVETACGTDQSALAAVTSNQMRPSHRYPSGKASKQRKPRRELSTSDPSRRACVSHSSSFCSFPLTVSESTSS